MELALFSFRGKMKFHPFTRDRLLFAVVVEECRGHELGLAATLN